jgi:hypothetical protein
MVFIRSDTLQPRLTRKNSYCEFETVKSNEINDTPLIRKHLGCLFCFDGKRNAYVTSPTIKIFLHYKCFYCTRNCKETRQHKTVGIPQDNIIYIRDHNKLFVKFDYENMETSQEKKHYLKDIFRTFYETKKDEKIAEQFRRKLIRNCFKKLTKTKN